MSVNYDWIHSTLVLFKMLTTYLKIQIPTLPTDEYTYLPTSYFTSFAPKKKPFC